MKKIAIVFGGTTGGVPKIMTSVANGLSSRGYVCSLVTNRLDPKFKHTLDPSVVLFEADARSAFSLANFAIDLHMKRRFDLIIVSQQHLNILVLALNYFRRAGSKIIACQHNTLSEVSQRTWINRLFPTLCSVFYRHAEKIICVSSGVKQDLIELTGLSEDAAIVITNPVLERDERDHCMPGDGLDWMSKRSRIDHPVVVAAGILKEQKDFPTFLHTIQLLPQNFRGIIFGDGPLREDLETLAVELGIENRVHFAGHVRRVHRLFPHADVFFLSSKWEGLPTVLIEALASGVQIVATDCKSGPQEILNYGEFGRIVSVGNCWDAALAIEEICNTPRSEQDRVKAIHFAYENFSAEVAIDKYQRLVEKVLKSA